MAGRKKSGARTAKKNIARTSPTDGLSGITEPYFPIPVRVVGIGASAGGLGAFRELLSHLTDNTGMAFVFVQHLARDQKSSLAEILSRSTTMPVIEVGGETPVVPNRVYVIPPKADMALKRGVLRLEKRPQLGRHMPVDRLFTSLAQEVGADAIGIILSGADGDGTEGAKAIKAAGGTVFAQDQSASFDAMPTSAIAEGVVDSTLSPRQIAERLVELANQPTPGVDPASDEEFDRILELLLGPQRVELAQYKTPTIQRRIERRMNLGQDVGLTAYRERLETDAAERDALYGDVLIGVTRFFRDPGKLDILKKKVFPLLLNGRKPDDALRVWVPGCSTGEEAYSLAIAIAEFLEDTSQKLSLQIFATDANPESITFARSGRYPDAIEKDVSADRLARFFVRERAGYSVNRHIRSFCVFAQHDLLKNPPFSRMDLISCSNLLIYLHAPQQQRVINTFRYAIKTEGFLALGLSERVGPDSGFAVFDLKQKIYRPSGGRRAHLDLVTQLISQPFTAQSAPSPPSTPISAVNETTRAADLALLARFAPPALVLNDALDVIEFRGDVQRFLNFATGVPSFQLSSLVSSALLPEISAAVREAVASGAAVSRPAISVTLGGPLKLVAIEVLPVSPSAGPPSFVVAFRETEAHVRDAAGAEDPADGEIPALRRELETARNYVKEVTSRHVAASGDINAASEELQSTNEELQSTVEELETAKEELQSTNEELTTLNDELRVRNADLIHLGDDLMNLLGGIDTAVIMVDRELIVRRFNPTAQNLISLLGTDLGRPIFAFKPLLDVPDFIEFIENVIETGEVMEKDVVDKQGHSYSLRMRPYRTTRNEINGVVITLVDTHELRTLLARAEEARKIAENSVVAADEARVEATEANRVKDEFLSTLSHELRTPITSILGWSQLMRMAAVDEPTFVTGIASIERATRAQIRLIDDLLDISRITTGRLRLEQAPITLSDLVAETLTVIQPAADAKSIVIKTDGTDADVVVRADADRLRQVLWNLLINAVKFTPERGSIAIVVERDLSQARLIVTDSGEGIDPEFLPFVFDRFRQADSGTRRFRSGLGLGLAITRYLVELHGGSVSAASAGNGQGSTFTVTLPLYSGEGTLADASQSREISETLPSLESLRILVVDDDPDTIAFMTTILERCGAEVLRAGSASEAFAELRGGKPDLIVSDIAMPGQDGFDLIRAIRALGTSEGEIPAIALTAYTSAEERERILAAGFQRYLSKPASVFDLAHSIVELTQPRK